MVENHSTSGLGDAANSLAKAIEVMKCIASDDISIATCPKCDPADYNNPATKHCRDCPRVAARVVLEALSERHAELADLSWRTMDSAPKDGTPILARIQFNRRDVAIVRFTRYWVSDWGEWNVNPVVWMPLPPPPSTATT